MYEMESKRQTESVLAKLMGLEGPNKRLQCGKQRVLSERYLRDIALICQHRKWSFDRFSVDVDDEMLDTQGLQTCPSSDEFLESYEKEADKMFHKFRLLNSTQKADRYCPSSVDYSFKSSSEMGSVSYKPLKSVLCDENVRRNYYPKTSVVRRKVRLGHGFMETRGVAKQVCNRLQHSVWHHYSKEVRCLSTSGFGKLSNFPGNMKTKNSNCGNRKFHVHRDWCLNTTSTATASLSSESEAPCEQPLLIASDLNEFGERDFFEDSQAVPLSPEEISAFSDVENLTHRAMERVFDQLPDMLQQIGCFTSTDPNYFDALTQQVVGDALIPLNNSDNGSPPHPVEAHLHTVHGSQVKLEQSKTELSVRMDSKETQVSSYLVDVLAELGLQYDKIRLGKPLEKLINPLVVFESLENKYSKQSSWLRSERKLLFDRIKWALSDILHPQMGITTSGKPRRTKLCVLEFKQERIKEDLLDVLVNQEKEATRESSKKMYGMDKDWLLLVEEDTQIVVKEIEEAFIDELLEEFISSEMLI